MLKKILKFAPVAALLIVVAAVYSAELRAIPVTASLASVTGDVRVTLPDGTTTQGTVNMALPSGTRIATGAKSSAVIKWSASNTLKINPFTNFTIKDIDVDPRTKTVTSSLDLQTGKIKAKAEKLHSPSSEFSISTPTAVAGVRGTEFDMENTPENTTSVTTRTGAVEVTSQGQSVMAVGGTQVVVEPNQPPAPPVPVTEEEMNSCEVDEDCMSHHCVDGQCVGESESMSGGGCKAKSAACEADGECCGKVCAEGVCAAAAETAAQPKPEPEPEEEEEGTEAGRAATCFVELIKPVDGGVFPLSGGSITVSGTTLPGASCSVGGLTATAGANGEFTSEYTLGDAGDKTLEVVCSSPDGACSAEAKAEIEVVGPPALTVSQPAEGFVQCPNVAISGMTNPGVTVYVNGVPIASAGRATIGADGSFSLDNYYLTDCSKPIEFSASDQFSQTTRLIVNSGATLNPTRLGVIIENIELSLIPSGTWQDGRTSVEAVATVMASTPISGAVMVTFKDGAGASLGNRMLTLIEGLKTGRIGAIAGSEPEVFYAQAVMTLTSGPANPFVIEASIEDKVARGSIVLTPIACSSPSDCDDNNPLTIDTCSNPGTLSAVCVNTPCNVACSQDDVCNDSNPLTFDVCSAPGTCAAACVNTAIACAADADCNDSVAITFDTCSNPGELSATCVNTTVACAA
ncbi:MAG TPA: FecR domain-containing protein, partial [bacterium]|nr:FecR domain-containing protein [bacterium]